MASAERTEAEDKGQKGAPRVVLDGAVHFRPKGPASFWGLWWATGISATGDGLVIAALPLLAITITKDPLAIAGITAAGRAAMALMALPGGVITDRFSRRVVMTTCNLVAGVVLAALVVAIVLGERDLVMVYLVAFVLAGCDVTYMLASQASVPAVVEGSQLAKANGRLMAAQNGGQQFVGPGIGGVVFSLARSVPFVLDSVSFFFSAALLQRSLPRSFGDSDALARNEPQSLKADLGKGWNFFRKDRVLRLLAGSMSSITFGQNIVFGLLVIYGTKQLHLGPVGYGLFLAFSAAFGVAGFPLGSFLEKRLGSYRLVVLGITLTAFSYVGLAFTRWVVLAVFVFGVQEAGTAIANVGTVTIRQQRIPRHMYGRVVSLHRLFVATAAPLGAVVGGVIASMTSVPVAMVIAGAICVAMVMALGPSLLSLGSPRAKHLR